MSKYVAFADYKQPVMFEAQDDNMAMREAELIWPDCWTGIAVYKCTNKDNSELIGIIDD